LNNRTVFGVMAASTLGGILYWLIEFMGYLFGSFSRGNIPLDAFVIAVPIILFAWAAGLLVCLPLYALLEKQKKAQKRYILFLSPVISIVIVGLVAGKFSTMDVGSLAGAGLAGFLSGLFFCRISKVRE
jgi:hypothetical protein